MKSKYTRSEAKRHQYERMMGMVKSSTTFYVGYTDENGFDSETVYADSADEARAVFAALHPDAAVEMIEDYAEEGKGACDVCGDSFENDQLIDSSEADLGEHQFMCYSCYRRLSTPQQPGWMGPEANAAAHRIGTPLIAELVVKIVADEDDDK